MLFNVIRKQRCDFDIKFLIELTRNNQDLDTISKVIANSTNK